MKAKMKFLPLILLATACGSPEAPTQAPAPPAAPSTPSAPTVQAPLVTVSGTVLTTLTGDVHTAMVELAVRDEAGRPLAGVELRGAFTANMKEELVLVSDKDGIARASAAGPAGHGSVGFNVTSATVKGAEAVAARVKDGVIYPAPCCPLRGNPTL